MSSPAETIVLYLLVDCFCNTTLYKIFLETRFLMVSIFHNFHVAVGFHVVFLFDRCFGQLGPSQLPRWLGFRRIWTWVFQCPSQSLRAFQESLGLLATVKGYGFSLKQQRIHKTMALVPVMAPKVELLIGFWPLPFFTHTKPIAFASMNTHKLPKKT